MLRLMPAWGADNLADYEAAGLRAIAAALRSWRLRRRLSQVQLAWLVGLNQSTISRLERGNLRSLRLRTLARLVGALRADPSELLVAGPPGPRRRLPGEGAPER